MNNLINDLKAKINTLNNKISDTEKIKKEYADNTEKIRLFIVRNVIIGGIMHVIGYFTTTYLILAGMLFACLSVVPFGIVYLHRENVDDKYQKEIDRCNEELKKANKQLEQYTNVNNMEPLKNINIEKEKNDIFVPSFEENIKGEKNSISKQKKSQ